MFRRVLPRKSMRRRRPCELGSNATSSTQGEPMESTRNANLGGLPSTFSRRTLLKGAVAVTVAASAPKAFGQPPTGAPRGTVWLYIGTYTGGPGPRGRSGEGIYLSELDLATGELTILRLVAPALPT